VLRTDAPHEEPEVFLIATASEVCLAVEAPEELADGRSCWRHARRMPKLLYFASKNIILT
jgi:transketolase